MNVAHVGPCPGTKAPPGLITDASGAPIPRLIFVILSSCTWNNDGTMDRLSPAYLGFLLRCLAALTMPHLEFSKALILFTTDPSLNYACQRTMCRTKSSPKKEKNVCVSVYHEPGDRNIFDPRSRTPMCARCFGIEDNLRKSAWPLVTSLNTRLDAVVAKTLLATIKKITRTSIMKFMNAETHDLFLCNVSLKNSGHWLYRATPFAASVLSLQRSKNYEELRKLIPQCVTRGWAQLPAPAKRKSYGPHLVCYKTILFLDEWHKLFVAISGKPLVLSLVAPTYAEDRIDTWSLAQLSDAIKDGDYSFCAATTGTIGPALNFILDVASAKNSGVTVADIDDRHYYTGTCSKTRQHLDDEAAGGWRRELPEDIKALLEFIRAGGNDRQGIQAALRTSNKGRKRRSKKGPAHGEKPAKRAAVSTQATTTGGAGGGETRDSGERATVDEEGNAGAIRETPYIKSCTLQGTTEGREQNDVVGRCSSPGIDGVSC